MANIPRLATIVLLSLFLGVTASEALEDNSQNPKKIENLSIFGFGDLLVTFDQDKTNNVYNLNQSEISFEYQISEEALFSLAIAYDGEKFGIGSFFYEQLLSSTEISSISFGVGQVDIPFGLEYEVYASIDRDLITAPINVNETHAEWNDIGAYINYTYKKLSGTFYTANGYEHEHLNKNDSVTTTDPGFAVGMQTRFSAGDNLSIGGSLGYIDGIDESADILLTGVDVILKIQKLESKAEVIRQDFRDLMNSNLHEHGYYLQTKYDFGSFYMIARASSFHHIKKDSEYQFSSGIGIHLNDGVILRSEWQHLTNSNDNQVVFQLAFGF